MDTRKEGEPNQILRVSSKKTLKTYLVPCTVLSDGYHQLHLTHERFRPQQEKLSP